MNFIMTFSTEFLSNMKCDGHVESSGHAGALYISSLQAGLKESE